MKNLSLMNCLIGERTTKEDSMKPHVTSNICCGLVHNVTEPAISGAVRVAQLVITIVAMQVQVYIVVQCNITFNQWKCCNTRVCYK